MYTYIYIYRICIHIIYPSWIIWLWKSDIGSTSRLDGLHVEGTLRKDVDVLGQDSDQWEIFRIQYMELR